MGGEHFGPALGNKVALDKYGKLHYYQKRSGAEIDFILPEKKTALEVKLKGLGKDYMKLKKLSQFLALEEYYIISQDFSSDTGVVLAQDV